MKRISARILSLLVSVALLPPALAEAKTQRSPAAKSVRAATAKVKLPVKAKPKTPTQKASVAPGLPDRNPLRAAPPAPEPQETAGASPAPSAAPDTASDPETTAGLQDLGAPPASETLASETPSASTTIAKRSAEEAVPKVSRPDRNPTPPSLIGSPASPLPAPHIVTDMPLPDANPSRTGGLDTLKGTLAPAIAAETPVLDYPSILKSILSYQISEADEANLREVL